MLKGEKGKEEKEVGGGTIRDWNVKIGHF